jgi:hypothetical protein
MKPYDTVISELNNAFEEGEGYDGYELNADQLADRVVYSAYVDFDECLEDDEARRQFWLNVAKWAETIAYSVGACR